MKSETISALANLSCRPWSCSRTPPAHTALRYCRTRKGVPRGTSISFEYRNQTGTLPDRSVAPEYVLSGPDRLLRVRGRPHLRVGFYRPHVEPDPVGSR